MGIKCPKCQHDNPDDTLYCGKCATSLIAADDIPISITKTIISPAMEGSTIAGKYRIIEKLGEGGMGVVYKAEDTRLDRMVALKFLPPELMKDPDAKERFVREAKAAAALSHPNICTIHEIDEEEGKSFIVMEYIEGQSIREKIKKSPLEIPGALDIAIQAAQGLEEAHKRGILHRDIKSANIMVTESGQAKVMDFGLAKVTGASLLTREASTMGTVAYMSPEQAQGQNVDQRTDIWSLGVALYEMLTGQLPFLGETDQTVMYAIGHKIPVPVKKIVPKVKPDLERVVEKALEKKSTDRYQSMGELLEDLRAIAEGLKPIRAKARLFKGRILGIKRPFFYAGIVILAALVVSGVYTLFPDRVEVLDSIAILPLVNDSGDPSQDYFANSLTDRLIAEFYKVSALRVVSRQAVMAYAETKKSPQQIARELNVNAIVEASVLKSGNKVRLIARLIDPKRNQQLWSDTLEREYSDILFLQSDLAQAIVKGIRVTVLPEENALLASTRKVNPEAYDLYLQGIDSLWPTDISLEEANLNSIDLFDRAIAIDPDFAEAYAWRGFLLWHLGINDCFPEKDVYPKAMSSIMKALEIDGALAMGHNSMAWIKLTQDWDFVGAEKEFLRALELEPGNPHIQFDYSAYQGKVIGRFDEAIARFNHLKKDPYIQKLLLVESVIFLLNAGRYKEALEAAKEAVALDPTGYFNLIMLADAYALNGIYTEAISQVEKMMEFPAAQNDSVSLLQAARIQALSGRQEQALKTMEQVKELLRGKKIDAAFSMAAFYTALGDRDQALKYLNDAYENHSGTLIVIKSNWYFHSLHDDPRFQDLVKKVGFPAVQMPFREQ